jgi:hypothetical protein
MTEAQKMLLVGRVIAGSRDNPRLALELAARKWPMEFAKREARLLEHTGADGVEALLGDRQPVSISLRTRELIIRLLEEDEANTIEGMASE